MAIDWDNDLLAPLMAGGPGGFGEDVQPFYTPKGGKGFPVDGVFDDGYAGLNLEGAEPEFQTVKPTLGVRPSQFPAGVIPASGDSVYIASKNTTYKVANPRPDGHGWTRLDLMTTGAP